MSKTYIGAYNVINPNEIYNQTSGTVTNPMTSDLDAGGNKIINLGNPADAGDVVCLSYLESVLPVTTGFIQNPMTSTLNANNNSIVNIPTLVLKDAVQSLTTYSLALENGSVVTNDVSDTESALMHIAINQGGTSKPYFTDFRGHPISNIGELNLLSGGKISGANNSIQLNCPLDMNNNYIKDVQNIQFFNAPPLEIDLSNNLVYDDSIVVTAANIGGYISQANWEPNAASDLNMTTHNINLTTGNVNLQTGKLIMNNTYSIGTDVNNDLTFDNNKVIVCEPKKLQSLQFSDSTPGSAMTIDRLNPIVFMNDSISQTGNLVNPVFDINIAMTMQTVFTANLDSAQIEIGLCNVPNPLNGIDNIISSYVSF